MRALSLTAQRLARRAGQHAAVPLLFVACAETSNISRTDTPPELGRVADSLEQRHFRGVVAVERPADGVLRLVLRDPEECGRQPAPLDAYAARAARATLDVYRPSPRRASAPIGVVQVRMTRTHRFGALVWATSLARFEFARDSLRALSPAQAPSPCARSTPPAILRPDST